MMELTRKQEDGVSFIDVTNVMTASLRPKCKLTTLSPSYRLRVLIHGMVLLAGCFVRWRATKLYVRRVIRLRPKRKIA